MKSAHAIILADISHWARSHGMRIKSKRLSPGTPCEFNGISCTTNPDYSRLEQLFYLTHALGSIVLWSLEPCTPTKIFAALRGAKQAPNPSHDRKNVLAQYRDFEEESSSYAVWLLNEHGHHAIVDAYTNFMRADLEALTIFHRNGPVPVWRDFFNRWNSDVLVGRRVVSPFIPRVVPAGFSPILIENQRVLQFQNDVYCA